MGRSALWASLLPSAEWRPLCRLTLVARAKARAYPRRNSNSNNNSNSNSIQSETITSNRDGGVTNSLLVITGGMGAGKTSILGEASDLLALRQIAHAAIDLDALGLAWLPSAPADGAMYRNLRSVCENYAALGVHRFLLARAMEDRDKLNICRDAVSATDMVVCRLIAGTETMQLRVQMRETGISHREYIARVAKLNAILEHAQLEDFTITNENRSITDAAFEMLVKAGWISN